MKSFYLRHIDVICDLVPRLSVSQCHRSRTDRAKQSCIKKNKVSRQHCSFVPVNKKLKTFERRWKYVLILFWHNKQQTCHLNAPPSFYLSVMHEILIEITSLLPQKYKRPPSTPKNVHVLYNECVQVCRLYLLSSSHNLWWAKAGMSLV